jgi:hypothetical protein
MKTLHTTAVTQQCFHFEFRFAIVSLCLHNFVKRLTRFSVWNGKWLHAFLLSWFTNHELKQNKNRYMKDNMTQLNVDLNCKHVSLDLGSQLDAKVIQSHCGRALQCIVMQMLFGNVISRKSRSRFFLHFCCTTWKNE